MPFATPRAPCLPDQKPDPFLRSGLLVKNRERNGPAIIGRIGFALGHELNLGAGIFFQPLIQLLLQVTNLMRGEYLGLHAAMYKLLRACSTAKIFSIPAVSRRARRQV